jgi:hypothetical protein
MKGQEALPEHLADDALWHRSTISRGGRVPLRKVVSPASCGISYSYVSSRATKKRSVKGDLPMYLVPSDPVPKTALRTELNQKTPGRPHHLSFVSDYVGVPQGSQYPGFLPDSCHGLASPIRLGCFEGDRLRCRALITSRSISVA